MDANNCGTPMISLQGCEVEVTMPKYNHICVLYRKQEGAQNCLVLALCQLHCLLPSILVFLQRNTESNSAKLAALCKGLFLQYSFLWSKSWGMILKDLYMLVHYVLLFFSTSYHLLSFFPPWDLSVKNRN